MDIPMLLLGLLLAAFATADGYRVVSTEPLVEGADAAEVAAAQRMKMRRTVAAVVTALGAVAAFYMSLNGGW